MNHTIHINLSQVNEIEFDLVLEKITPETLDVRLNIELTNFNLNIKCEKREGTKWLVKVPVLSSLTKEEELPFKVEVIVNGYYFVAAEGKFLSIKDTVATVSNVENKSTTQEVRSIQSSIQSEEKGPKETNNLHTNNTLSTDNTIEEVHVEKQSKNLNEHEIKKIKNVQIVKKILKELKEESIKPKKTKVVLQRGKIVTR